MTIKGADIRCNRTPGKRPSADGPSDHAGICEPLNIMPQGKVAGGDTRPGPHRQAARKPDRGQETTGGWRFVEKFQHLMPVGLLIVTCKPADASKLLAGPGTKKEGRTRSPSHY